MNLLKNKNILLGVTGGIAAYKSAELVRRLQDQGANVRVVMTEAAQSFITPLTMQALSGNPVSRDLFDEEAEAAMGHIELSRWADLVLVAPATANFIAKLAHGEGADLLLTLCLATSAQIALAPAMNQGMWSNVSTQKNLSILKERAVFIFGPGEGTQACGDVGLGRMLEVDEITALAANCFDVGVLQGKTVVITAGPTRENLDPVRYMSNYSSGKMGYCLADAAVEAGANTILISGPVSLSPPENVELVSVVSARDMYDAAIALSVEADIFIGSAAVADYRPKMPAENKIKKGSEDEMALVLVKNPDVIAGVASLEKKPYTVGFAAETQQVEEYASKKLLAKNLDMIIANDVSDSEIGFNSEENAVVVIEAENKCYFEKMRKASLARNLISLIAQRV